MKYPNYLKSRTTPGRESQTKFRLFKPRVKLITGRWYSLEDIRKLQDDAGEKNAETRAKITSAKIELKTLERKIEDLEDQIIGTTVAGEVELVKQVADFVRHTSDGNVEYKKGDKIAVRVDDDFNPIYE